MPNWMRQSLAQNNDARFFKAPRVAMGDRRLKIYQDRYNRIPYRSAGLSHRARLIMSQMIWMG